MRYTLVVNDRKPKHTQLQRQVGVWGAVFMGLGAMVGTGVFFSIFLAAQVAGPSVILATFLAAIVAACNGLSSAQLAAAHPVSGGTYEYGYKYLTPQLGFTAGWMFLIAKSASAATAALAATAYIVVFLRDWLSPTLPDALGVGVLLAILIGITLIVYLGIQRSNTANIMIVSVTLFALSAYILGCLPMAFDSGGEAFKPFFKDGASGVLHATALMFVAYTGYGRIATLGEEVKEPARTIPMAIVTTMTATSLLYVAVAAVSVAIPGTSGQFTGLQRQAAIVDLPGLVPIVTIGAITAMLGVLLNLVLGLSRVLLAMGRREDAPSTFAHIDPKHHSPQHSVIGVAVIVLIFTLLGDIKLAWSFSAFTVLIYYSITNLAALKQPGEERRYPRIIQYVGLFSCLFLAFQVDVRTWQIGIGLILTGLAWHTVAHRRRLAETGKAD